MNICSNRTEVFIFNDQAVQEGLLKYSWNILWRITLWELRRTAVRVTETMAAIKYSQDKHEPAVSQ